MAKLTKKEQAILNNMNLLEITREEAEELYAFDNDEIENDEVDAIEEKVITKKATAEGRSSLEKVKHMKAKKKADANKEGIIAELMGDVESSTIMFQPKEMSATKMSFMDVDGNFYTMAITKHKKQPDGYSFDEEIAAETLAAKEANRAVTEVVIEDEKEVI